MKKKYLIRLDDACPTMHKERWARIEEILDKYDLKPMVGVIPDNNDPKQKLSPADPNFWQHVKAWEAKGWEIALHGCDHCYISNEGGINPLWKRSEFAGIHLNEQKRKIRHGVEILRKHGIEPKYFFAPSHTFDQNTLTALSECSSIRRISDTIATAPYKKYGFIFIPQLGGKCRKILLPGVWTFCLHPSAMSDEEINQIDGFLKKHYNEFICFNDIDYDKVGKLDLLSKLIRFLYFTKRRLRNPNKSLYQ